MIDCCIITVSYNSSSHIRFFLSSIKQASKQASFHVFILDNHSNDTAVLEKLCDANRFATLIKSDSNIGFCKGNNVALKKALELNPKAVLFLNPDAFLTDGWLDKAKSILKADDSIGVLSGPLMHFDFESKKPSGLIDSLGIDVTWYGKWFDIDQGLDFLEFSKVTYPPAVCGALMLIPRKVIDQLMTLDGFVFNEAFFMYKEDVDLSLRIGKLGYSVNVHPDLSAFHCRGWNKDRKLMPFLSKKLSAVNDVRVAIKHRLLNLPFALVKWVYVCCIEKKA